MINTILHYFVYQKDEINNIKTKCIFRISSKIMFRKDKIIKILILQIFWENKTFYFIKKNLKNLTLMTLFMSIYNIRTKQNYYASWGTQIQGQRIFFSSRQSQWKHLSSLEVTDSNFTFLSKKSFCALLCWKKLFRLGHCWCFVSFSELKWPQVCMQKSRGKMN